jgi:ABC-type dipeptide/oligopeptide/nickel transport system permease subunit
MSFLSVLQSWYQGTILFSRNTRGIPESMAIFLVTVLVVLAIGVALGEYTGLYVGFIGFSLANFTQTIWLWVRSRPIMKMVTKRDENIGWSVT